ncbi:MAG: hypothetical protein JXN61_09385 [Sedimentisphaerales bacterium]|nr:hypothetical protein [Sedimentisphaerales bacterium]
MQAEKWKIRAAVSCLSLLVVSSVLFGAEPGFGGVLPRYEITDLSAQGCGRSTPYAINDIGQVAGHSHDSEGGAFFWDRRIGMIDLGVLRRRDWSVAYGVNNLGQAVGFSGEDDGEAFIWDSENGMRRLEGVGFGTIAYAINNAGQVVVDAEFVSFLWDPNEGLIELGSLDGDRTLAYAINNTGQVAGHAYTSVSEYHAFIWDRATGMRDLGTLGGRYSRAYGINDTGQVVGDSSTTTGDWRAFLWSSNTGMIDLGEGYANAINNAGQVVGCMSANGPAFYWDSGIGMIRLSDLLPANSGWQSLGRAYAINNRGQIVGTGLTDNGSLHGFLMTPVVPTIYYVDADALGPTRDGLSWATAFNHLQDALALAWHGDEIRVAQGIYRPDRGNIMITPDDRAATFRLFNGVAIKGGYAGFGEPVPNARDIELYEAVLSGDLHGNDSPDFVDYEENSYHVVTAILTDETAVLDGFTITAGNANGPSDYSYGGGTFCDSGATVRNCTFSHNFAVNGGGMCCNSWCDGVPDLRVTNCAFIRNRAGDLGGGLWLRPDDSHLLLTNCTFSGNTASNGGGIYCSGTYTTISNCILWDDTPDELYLEWSGLAVIYSDVRGSWPGEGNISVDPCFADANNDDYHLKSQAGRWDANEGRWTIDAVTSLCIDAGDPMTPIMHEPFPNGGIVNMGAYGGTAEASKSYFGKPPCEIIVAGDINGDCIVDFKDAAIAFGHWLEDNSP